jgi:Na+-translocating ferredoxin:NAD+ oxidoreductase RNF subunit RnfB
MTIECGRCEMRGIGCRDCAVAVIESQNVTDCLTGEQVRALRVLADAGLVPPLRFSSVGMAAPTWTSTIFPDAKAS